MYNKMNKICILLLFIKTICGEDDDDMLFNDDIPKELKILQDRLQAELNSSSDKTGEDIVNDLSKYYKKLHNLHSLLDSEDKEKQQKGKVFYNRIAEKGGPPLLHEEVDKLINDYTKLIKKYGAKDGGKETNSIRELMTNINEIWEDIEEDA